MAYKKVKEKVTLEREIESYEPDACACLKLEITGAGRGTEDAARAEFLKFWQKVKEIMEAEISCGTEKFNRGQ